MPSPLHTVIDELMPTMRRGDVTGFQRLFEQLATRGRELSPDELTAALGELARVLAHWPAGVFARLALTAGAFVEWGGSPMALAAEVPEITYRVMTLRIEFSELWPAVCDGRPEPDPDQAPSMNELVSLFSARADDLGMTKDAAAAVARSYFDTPHWVNLMITLLARREFRAATHRSADIGDVAAKLSDSVRRAEWLPGLAQVLDDEPVVVLDDATGRGFRLTMAGIGDNYQLHTLLADRLIGDPARGLLPGHRPMPSWVTAATTAPPRMPADDLIVRRFRLYDGTGEYISPEGRPADIPLVAGARVIVLHPPLGNYFWDLGRVYEHMIPALCLDHIMTSDEADSWRARVAPARETDLFAGNKRA